MSIVNHVHSMPRTIAGLLTAASYNMKLSFFRRQKRYEGVLLDLPTWIPASTAGVPM
ncbi:hypothetical protein L4D76_05530 [Photobacterium sagamiensis]|uniref:hypothetical protein n=1 Tax=Photobacterium sagamiensis TaxID=2910241 RepID=UPI003D0E434F